TKVNIITGTPMGENSVWQAEPSPAAISDLTALAGSNEGDVALKWTAPGDDGTSGNVSGGLYRIKAATYVITAANFSAVSMNMPYSFTLDKSTSYTTKGEQHNYTLTGLYPGTTYYAAIKLRDATGEWNVWPGTGTSVNSKSFKYALDLEPEIVQNVQLTATDGEILINWTEPNLRDLDYFEVERDSSTPYDFIDAYTFNVDTGAVSYTDTGLENGVTYYYKVTTWDTFPSGTGPSGLYSVALSSSYSVTKSTKPEIGVPFAPTGFAGVVQSTYSINWTWNDVPSNEEGFEIRNKDGSVAVATNTLTADTTEWTQTGLTTNTSSLYETVYAWNMQGYSSPSTAVSFPVYSKARAPINLQISNVAVSSVTLSWAVNSNPSWTKYGIAKSTDNFNVSFDTGVVFSDGLTSNTTSITNLENGTTYWFRVWAYNEDSVKTDFSNIKSTQTESIITVAINEIAWMGTQSSSYDEWIEFYNNTNSDIDIANWSIYGADTEVTLNFSGADPDGSNTTIIPANGYLIYANAADVFSSGASVAIWDSSIGMNAAGDHLILYNAPDGAGKIIDEVDNNDGTWMAGNSDESITMERIDSTVDGNISSNWENNNQINIKGKDADGNNIYGTPKSTNSGNYPPDTVAPNAITNLSALTGDTAGEIILSWTAPGNDGTSGNNTATAQYELRFDTYVVNNTTSWWNEAVVYDSTRTVKNQGKAETFTVMRAPGATYWFAIKTYDASGNASDIDTNTQSQLSAPPDTQAKALAKEGWLGSGIRINEVAPSEDVDWIEFYNSSNTVNINGWEVSHNFSKTKTFPDFTFSSGTYIVLHFGPAKADENNSDINGNGYRDFYYPIGELSSGKNTPADFVISLRNPSRSNKIVDALAVADREGTSSEWLGDLYGYPSKSQWTYTFTKIDEFNVALSSGQWVGIKATTDNDSTVEEYCFSWKYGKRGYSISRDKYSTDGTVPSRLEWSVAENPTMGKQNFIDNDIDETAPGQISDLEVSKGPYKGSVKISFTDVGDDGASDGGVVSSYDVRYSLSPIVTESNFIDATPVVFASKENVKDRMRDNDPAGDDIDSFDIYWEPGAPGSAQEHIISELSPGVNYYFAVKGEDEQSNKGSMSTGINLSTSASSTVGSPVMINEVAPLINNGKDWVEFYNATGSSINIGGWKICVYANSGKSYKDYFNTVEELPENYILPADAYLVLNFGDIQSKVDEIPPNDTNGNGYYDLYDSYAQFNDADDIVVLLDNDWVMVDAMFYSNRSGSFNEEDWDDVYVESSYFNDQWAPEQTNEYTINSEVKWDNFADWSQGTSEKSLGRDVNSTDTDDTGIAKNDWLLMDRPTRGIENDYIPPAAITDLTALSGSAEGSVALNWTAPGDDGTVGNNSDGYYEIRYASYAVSGSSWSWWNSISSDTSSANLYSGTRLKTGPEDQGNLETEIMNSLFPGVTYYVGIKTYDNIENNAGLDVKLGGNSPAYAVAFDTNPPAPSNLTGFAEDSQVLLQWTEVDVDDFNFYRVYYDSAAPFNNSDMIVATETTNNYFIDENLTNNNTYYYKVKTVDKEPGILESKYSNLFNIYPDAGKISPPVNFTAVSNATDTIKWTWTDTSSSEDGFRLIGESGSIIFSSNTLKSQTGVYKTTSWFQTGMSPNQVSSIKSIVAVNSLAQSKEVSVSDYPIYSRANKPANLQIANVGISSMTISWNSNNNPPGTRFGISMSTDNFVADSEVIASYATDFITTNKIFRNLDWDTTYWFKVWAYNNNEVKTDSLGPVVKQTKGIIEVAINEIAWAGTDFSFRHEWIELYNNTNRDLDLTGWKIVAINKKSTATITSAEGDLNNSVISAGGYYLLEYSTDTINDIQGDFEDGPPYSFLNNDGEYLKLLNNNDKIIDEVDCSGVWFAGTNNPVYSMERENTYGSGSDSTNWSDNDGVTINGHDSGGTAINGTPRAKNSVWVPGLDFIKPGSVTDLTALAVDSEQGIQLSWTAPGDDGYSVNNSGGSYEIKFATFSFVNSGIDSWWNQIPGGYSDKYRGKRSISVAASVGNPENVTISGLYPYSTYWFTIKVYDDAGSGSEYDDKTVAAAQANAMVSFNAVPATPQNLSVPVVTNNSMAITWDANSESDVNKYWLYRESSANSAPTSYTVVYATINDTNHSGTASYPDSSLDSNNYYSYWVSAVDEFDLASNPAGPESSTPDMSPPKFKSVSPQSNRALGKDIIIVEVEVSDNIMITDVNGKYRGINDSSSERALNFFPNSFNGKEYIGTADVDKKVLNSKGFEYYVVAKDQINTSTYPASGSWKTINTPKDVPDQKFITPSNPEVIFGSEVDEVVITDVRGKEIFSKKKGGSPFITWNPAENGKIKLESGLYIYQLDTKEG
nr:lamin tail domain-containing protein [Elusimicrobiota bacterium]